MQEKGEISQAFNNTLSMLTDLTSLSGVMQNELILTSVQINEDSYQFRFSYYFNSYPVMLEQEKHSISITATGDRVISADANLFDISEASLPNDEEDMYDLRTFNILSKNDIALGSIKADSMYIAYIKDENTVLLPSWIIEGDGLTILGLKEAED
jgi:regulatory protein YycH of two-component signal transduction system YycFG